MRRAMIVMFDAPQGSNLDEEALANEIEKLVLAHHSSNNNALALMLPDTAEARHIRKGTDYTVLSFSAIAQASNGPIRDDAPIVVYVGDDGMLFARPPGEFSEEGRFAIKRD